MNKCKVISVVNQKGGVGKSTTTINLGSALVRMGKKVLCIDFDPQGNLTMSLGFSQPDELPVTITNLLQEEIVFRMSSADKIFIPKEKYILSNNGLDFVPSSIDLASMENVLINTMSRENILKGIIERFKSDYEFIIIDCLPSLNILTINALNASDEIIVPVQAQFLSAKGLEMLLGTVTAVKTNLNANLKIAGVLITMLNERTNFQKEVVTILNKTYGDYIKIFNSKIPISVKVTEAQSKGISIFEHDEKGKVAIAYENFAKELLAND